MLYTCGMQPLELGTGAHPVHNCFVMKVREREQQRLQNLPRVVLEQ